MITIISDQQDGSDASDLISVLEEFAEERGGSLKLRPLAYSNSVFCSPSPERVPPQLLILVQPPECIRPAAETIAALKHGRLACPVLVVINEDQAPHAVRFLEAGASDFIVAPFRERELLPRVSRLLRPAEDDNMLLERLKQVVGQKRFVGTSKVFVDQLRKLPSVAACDSTVLISGETGTGKELCARAVHYLSRRSAKPFVPVDCGAIPAELIENELFGHEKGAYTSAQASKRGLAAEAEGGTLFLDELDSLSLTMQCKLLRFLQEKEFRPVGASKVLRADVRIIAASNAVLAEAVRLGRFRQDLLYRVNVLSLVMPPLRERVEDIPLLARHFLAHYASEFHKSIRDFSPEAVGKLVQYSWPGNARELQNIVERAVLACDLSIIDADHLELPETDCKRVSSSFQARKGIMLLKWECGELKRLLTIYAGNISAAARGEGKDSRAFRALLRKHRLWATRQPPYWDYRS